MTIDLLMIGKTDSTEIDNLVAGYLKRINRYIKFTLTVVPDLRNSASLPASEQKKAEGILLLKNIGAGDCVVLLDEKGETMASEAFAVWLSKRMNSSPKRLVFIIGGPYGFSPELYERADYKLSLSPMTFSHQLIRVVFTEQLYRAFSILRGEPYHHS